MKIDDSVYQAKYWINSALNASRGNQESREIFQELNQSQHVCFSPELLQIPSVAATVAIVAGLAAKGGWWHPRLETQAQEALNSLADFPKKC